MMRFWAPSMPAMVSRAACHRYRSCLDSLTATDLPPSDLNTSACSTRPITRSIQPRSSASVLAALNMRASSALILIVTTVAPPDAKRAAAHATTHQPSSSSSESKRYVVVFRELVLLGLAAAFGCFLLAAG